MAPHHIGFSPLRMRWDDLTFLHWRYDPADVQRLLPEGLTVETFDGSAWVALVPFRMRILVPGLRWVPWLWVFPETNVRTYVRGRSGRPGVWFFSLEASRFLASATGRLAYRVPYFWAAMSIDRRGERGEGDRWEYRSARRWPGPRGTASLVTQTVGPAIAADDVTPLEHFLTARYALYGTWASRLLYAEAWHEPWTLHRVEVHDVRDQLVQAAGLPAPDGEPLAHFSPGVEVRFGRPRRG